MLLRALLVLAPSLVYVASGASCGCSSLTIPVHVDVLVPKDPTDEFGGLKSNASSLRHVDATYNIYGVFCQPDAIQITVSDVLQLLVHGITYTSQYWSPPVEEFRNYSYAAFACDRGLSSLAIDWPGVGLSTRPVNASDVQYPTCAAALSHVARHLKTVSILPGVRPFKKVIGVGHSAGSGILNFGAIVDGARSPFAGLILTGSLSVAPGAQPPVSSIPSARDVDPIRWGALDPAYITTSNRTIFYPADAASFSPRMLTFDGFTMDVGSVSTFAQTPTTSLSTRYAGRVVKVVGAEDQLFCAGTGRCADVAALTAAERVLWPAARSFDVVVSQGSGHDLNLDFFAQGPFNTLVGFVEQFSGV
ncbi:Alpha/beta hydrolase family-domain-containing protein [Mycena pura]|uniref:Alpha/beta hydrolase family-domain-containing protein n=1 Tax=Mycena pura TaxID=153505 RepID=A0AAD6Y9W0_9AGAR|nr:Alpha/beta hydrolase family-domain-containing protein [Mycena pura]